METNTKAYFKNQKTDYLKKQLKMMKKSGGMKSYQKEIKEILKKRKGG